MLSLKLGVPDAENFSFMPEHATKWDGKVWVLFAITQDIVLTTHRILFRPLSHLRLVSTTLLVSPRIARYTPLVEETMVASVTVMLPS